MDQKNVDNAINYILKHTGWDKYNVAIVLGSGFGDLQLNVNIKQDIPYCCIPGFPIPGVEGHKGRLVIGLFGRVRVLVFIGRFHMYEGYTAWETAFPVWVASGLGVSHVILCCAAGGVSRKFVVGDFMLVSDHVNLTGDNPLRGVKDLKRVFVDMSSAYCEDMRKVTLKVSRSIPPVSVKEGVLGCVLGPSYETKAELNMLNLLGIDAVSMSTVHETIAARFEGIRTLALSVITNTHLAPQKTVTHTDVLSTVSMRLRDFSVLLTGVLKEIDKMSLF